MTAKRIAEALPNEHYAVPFLSQMVAIQRAQAVEPIRVFLGTKPLASDRRALVAALAQIATEDAARIFADNVGDKHFHPSARDYFVKNPKLAHLLRAVGTANAGVAKTILAAVR